MNKLLLGNKNGESRLFLRILEIETIGWKTYPSKSSLILPLWFIRRLLSQNFDWLSVNFSMFFAHTDVGNIIRREIGLSSSFAMLLYLPRGLLSLVSVQLPVFFWNRCIAIIKNCLKAQAWCSLRVGTSVFGWRVLGLSSGRVRSLSPSGVGLRNYTFVLFVGPGKMPGRGWRTCDWLTSSPGRRNKNPTYFTLEKPEFSAPVLILRIGTNQTNHRHLEWKGGLLIIWCVIRRIHLNRLRILTNMSCRRNRWWSLVIAWGGLIWIVSSPRSWS